MKKTIKALLLTGTFLVFLFNIQIAINDGEVDITVQEVLAEESSNTMCWWHFVRGGSLSKIVCWVDVAGTPESCKTVNDIKTYQSLTLCDVQQ